VALLLQCMLVSTHSVGVGLDRPSSGRLLVLLLLGTRAYSGFSSSRHAKTPALFTRFNGISGEMLGHAADQRLQVGNYLMRGAGAQNKEPSKKLKVKAERWRLQG